MKTKPKTESIRAMLIAATEACGAKGASAMELDAYVAERRKVRACHTAMTRAVEDGVLWRIGKAHETRYYATKELMEEGREAWAAWVAERRHAIKEGRRTRNLAKAKEKYRIKCEAEGRAVRKIAPKGSAIPKSRVGANKSSIVRAPWTVDTPAIITPMTKITVAPPLPQPIKTNTYARSW